MSKTLRTAALVVGAVALAATGIGAAAGAGLLGAAATGAAGTIAGISAATIGTIGTLGSVATGVLSLAAGLTAKKPSARSTGSATEFTADPNAFFPMVIGRTGTAGNIVMRKTYDTRDDGANDRETFVTVLSVAGPVTAVPSFAIDRLHIGFDGAGMQDGNWRDHMWYGKQLGQSPQPGAFTFHPNAGTPPGWTGNHKLSGMAATYWTLRFDTKSKLYQNGVPAPMWTVEGVLAYDPRQDSTYPGGSGSCRANDKATWVQSRNPYIHGLTWIIGHHANGKLVMGLGAPLEAIDMAAYVEGANIADANGWEVGGVIYSGDGKWTSLKRILQAGMGEPLPLRAKVSCLVNTPRISLATIREEDLAGSVSVQTMQPRRDRINTITPRYRLEENNWQLLPGTPISVPEHVAEDRGKRSREVDYPFIQNTKQVATAVRYDIENAREFGPITMALKPVWTGYKPGDCVTVDLPEVGLHGQDVLLLQRDFNPSSGIPTLTGRSETYAKHAFALGQTTTPPPPPGVTTGPVAPVPRAGSWAAIGTELAANGTAIPAVVVSGAVDSPIVDAVIFEYRPTGSAEWIAGGLEPPQATKREITSVTSGTAYDVAVSYRARGIVGDRLVLGPVTVGTLTVPGGAAAAPIATRFTGVGAFEHPYPVRLAPGAAQYVSAAGYPTVSGGQATVVAELQYRADGGGWTTFASGSTPVSDSEPGDLAFDGSFANQGPQSALFDVRILVSRGGSGTVSVRDGSFAVG